MSAGNKRLSWIVATQKWAAKQNSSHSVWSKNCSNKKLLGFYCNTWDPIFLWCLNSVLYGRKIWWNHQRNGFSKFLIWWFCPKYTHDLAVILCNQWRQQVLCLHLYCFTCPFYIFLGKWGSLRVYSTGPYLLDKYFNSDIVCACVHCIWLFLQLIT